MTVTDDEPYDVWIQSVFDFLRNDAEYPHQIGQKPHDVYFSSRETAIMQIETWQKWYEDEKSVPEIRKELDISYRAVSARIEKIRNYLAQVAVGSHNFDAIRQTVQMLVDEYNYNIKDAMRAMFISSMVRTKTNRRGVFVRKAGMSVEQMWDLKEEGVPFQEIGRRAGVDKSTVSRMLARFKKDTQPTGG